MKLISKITSIYLIFFPLIGFCYPFSGIKFLDKEQKKSFDYQIDAYYSQIAYNQDFSDPLIMDPSLETDLYFHLIKNFLNINSFRFEVSANPLPILGVHLKKHNNSFYESSELFGFNLINILTEGFPEPGALSMFLGNRVYLGNKELGLTGVGLGGFLLSVGGQHIVNNLIFSDKWYEGEMKVKGASITKTGKISYSYRLGLKIHENRGVRDTMYVGVKRSHVDSNYSGWSPFYNSELEMRGDLAYDNWQITRLSALFGKKFPSDDKKTIYSVDFGAIWVRGKGYSGSLRESVGDPGWSFLLRPNMSF